MSRTFSLWRLMVGVTVVCVLCALVANFPQAAYVVAWAIPFLLPTVVVSAGLTWLSSKPIEACALMMAGASVGLMLSSGVPILSDVYSFNLLSKCWLPAVGAFVLGLPWVVFFPRWKAPRG